MGKINHVYILMDCKNCEPFYVGVSSNIEMRLRHHLLKSRKKNAGSKGTQRARRIICNGGSVIPLIVFKGDKLESYKKEHEFTVTLHDAGFKLENRKPSHRYACIVGKNRKSKRVYTKEQMAFRSLSVAEKVDFIMDRIKNIKTICNRSPKGNNRRHE